MALARAPWTSAATATRCWRAVDRMTPGDMPDFEPAMLLADQGFTQLQTDMRP